MSKRQELLDRLNEARAQVLVLLPQAEANHGMEIYPGWMLKEMLAHMTGWDDAVIASLRAHITGKEPGTPADRGVDEYNERTVDTREALDYRHIRQEWEATRRDLVNIIETMPEEKYLQPLVLPWGETGSVDDLLNIFIHHEHEHAGHIAEWLKNPTKSITGKH
jgi:hypothetical protein